MTRNIPIAILLLLQGLYKNKLMSMNGFIFEPGTTDGNVHLSVTTRLIMHKQRSVFAASPLSFL